MYKILDSPSKGLYDQAGKLIHLCITSADFATLVGVGNCQIAFLLETAGQWFLSSEVCQSRPYSSFQIQEAEKTQ